jgi:hypothetical protein
MKKLLLVLSIIYTLPVLGQSKFYKLSFSKQAYNYNPQSATSINNNTWWDDDAFNFPLPFKFSLFTDSSNQIYINGDIGLGAFLSIHNIDNANFGQGINVFQALSADLIDKDSSETTSLSPITYAVSGTVNNRIVKLEYRNAGFYNPVGNGFFADSLNMQIWFYEGSNKLELRFGPSNLVSSMMDLHDYDGPVTLLMDSLYLDANLDLKLNKMYFLTSNADTPILDSAFNTADITQLPAMDTNPRDSFVYTFTPVMPITEAPDAIADYQYLPLKILQVPNALLITNESSVTTQYYISNTSGQKCIEGILLPGKSTINLSGLADNIYLLRIQQGKHTNSYKIIK